MELRGGKTIRLIDPLGKRFFEEIRRCIGRNQMVGIITALWPSVAIHVVHVIIFSGKVALPFVRMLPVEVKY